MRVVGARTRARMAQLQAARQPGGRPLDAESVGGVLEAALAAERPTLSLGPTKGAQAASHNPGRRDP